MSFFIAKPVAKAHWHYLKSIPTSPVRTDNDFLKLRSKEMVTVGKKKKLTTQTRCSFFEDMKKNNSSERHRVNKSIKVWSWVNPIQSVCNPSPTVTDPNPSTHWFPRSCWLMVWIQPVRAPFFGVTIHYINKQVIWAHILYASTNISIHSSTRAHTRCPLCLT